MKKKVLPLLAAILLLAAFVLLIWNPFKNTNTTKQTEKEAVQSQESSEVQSEQQPDQQSETMVEQEQSVVIPSTELEGDVITLDALCLSNFRAVTGSFPEDGSDAACDDMFAITVDNQNDQALQYAVLELEREGTVYQFDLTTIPSGARCTIYEKNGASYPGDGEWKASIAKMAWFEEGFDLHMDKLGIRTADKIIELTNNTDEPISGPIYVYYKTLRDGVFDGGITYRCSVQDGLAPGESYSIMTKHYSQAESRLMFITYVQ